MSGGIYRTADNLLVMNCIQDEYAIDIMTAVKYFMFIGINIYYEVTFIDVAIKRAKFCKALSNYKSFAGK